MALRQQLIQKLEQRLSPQQIQLMKLLQVPTMELDQRIKQEIEENPALETGKENEKDLYETESDYEQEPKNLSLGVNFVYVVDDCVSGSNGCEYYCAVE